jgi:hypothetical protein
MTNIITDESFINLWDGESGHFIIHIPDIIHIHYGLDETEDDDQSAMSIHLRDGRVVELDGWAASGAAARLSRAGLPVE